MERHLEGRHRELKESLIGIEVFGRKPDYDPQRDPIVRTEARRLRARLAEYYKDAGRGAAVVIDLPKGGYVPAIALTKQTPEVTGSSQQVSGLRKFPVAASLLVATAVMAAVVVSVLLRPGQRSLSLPISAANNLYRQARAEAMRPGVSGVEMSYELFEEAIAKDPSFAPAYAGLASAEAVRSGFGRFTPSERASMIAKGWAAAEKAIRLDPLLPNAYDALGMMQARSAQWRQAEHSFRRAIEISPRDPLWRDHFAMSLLLPLGRIQEAIQQLQSEEELDPHSLKVHDALKLALSAAGRFDDTDFHCRHAVENEQQMSICWAAIFLRQGKPVDAIRVGETAWNGHLLEMGAEFLGVAYARAGRRQDAERIAAAVPRPPSKALIFAALGDKDRTFEILEQMVPQGPTRLGMELIAPEYAILNGDPRLNAIRKKAGLPD
ncbi:MAG TPA: hypothetical protein VKB88_30970 [Bryobacteraceae bacterium]|nr:hypothetical protein [Bryobacteraceae bacterium]